MASSSANAAWQYLDIHLQNGLGDRTSIAMVDRVVTFRELFELVCRTATVLKESSVRPGDRVLLALPDGPEFVACALATIRIGAIVVPMNVTVGVERAMTIVADCSPCAAVLSSGMDDVAAAISAERPECAMWSSGHVDIVHHPFVRAVSQATASNEIAEPRTPGDAAWIQYTSGSTGVPKGVVWPHSMLTALPSVAGSWYSSSDRCYCTSKLSSGYAFMDGVLLPLSAGATSILRPGRIGPLAVAQVMETLRPTLFYSLPTMYAAMLSIPDAAQRIDFSSVRRCVASGEFLAGNLVTRFAEEFGKEIVNEFGSSEAGDMLATEPGAAKAGACGRPFPGVEARVVDEDGRCLADDRPGFLEVHSPIAASGYWNRPEATRRTFRNGWVRTGDIVIRDISGDHYYVGRIDDIINVGGVKTNPAEVEEQLMRREEVAACAVVAPPEGTTTALPVMTAFIVPTPGNVADFRLRRSLLRYLRRTIGGEHTPGRVVFVDDLPTTVNGKTSKTLLRSQVQETVDGTLER